ncbi:DUF692 family multinuclear iron-containing protein, partial [Streptomyces sp. SID10815]|uniref:multinuclear nonheme iron-dependent oxidase n=1 Tax=Streptomyces sp. SID10815 TaxID=2706027 RepID=UPI001EF34B63
AVALGAPLVTEHIAFVRAGGALTASPRLEAGHLLPVPRTRDALDVLCENVRVAQDALPVPLAVENIAALLSWPGEELTEGQFLYELADRTGVRLLIDVANLHTNHVNQGEDAARALAELPLEALAYVHVAGGFERDGVWHDSHAHPVPEPVLDILTDLASRVTPPGILLERDENFPEPGELERELAAIGKAVELGRTLAAAHPRRAAAAPGTPPVPATPAAQTPAAEPAGDGAVGAESAEDGTAGAEPAGDGTVRAEATGDGTVRAETAGDGTVRAETAGDGTVRAETAGDGTVRAETAGDGTVRAETAGDGTVRAETAGDGTVRAETAGDGTVRAETAGDGTVRAETAGDGTVRAETAGD